MLSRLQVDLGIVPKLKASGHVEIANRRSELRPGMGQLKDRRETGHKSSSFFRAELGLSVSLPLCFRLYSGKSSHPIDSQRG